MKPTTKSSLWKILAVVVIAFISGWLINGIAENRQAEASTWTRFLLAFADTNTGIIEVVNGHSAIHYASPAATSILGYNDRELEGVDLTEILPKDMAPAHQVQMYYAMGLSQSDKLKTKVTAMLCKARRYDGSEVDVVIRLFMGKQSVFALINNAEETKYLPPIEPATDYHKLKLK